MSGKNPEISVHNDICINIFSVFTQYRTCPSYIKSAKGQKKEKND